MRITLSLDEVYELALRALTGSNTDDTNARPVADSLRTAEADGLHNAGLGHLPQTIYRGLLPSSLHKRSKCAKKCPSPYVLRP